MKNLNKIVMAVLIVVIIINIFMIFSNYFILSKIKNINVDNNIFGSLNVSDNPLSISGFSKVDEITVEKDGINLKIGCSSVKLVSHEYQLYSIERGLKGVIDIRPMIHDNIVDIFENYNITVIMAKITELRQDAYFGNLYLRQDNKILNIDAKPTDLIALSVRFKNPLYISDSIIKSNGVNICSKE